MGEMGAGIAKALAAAGYTVRTCLAGRSPESVARARAAGIETVATLGALLAPSSVFLSLVPSDAAVELAHSVAAARPDGRDLLFIEANAISVRSLAGARAAVERTGAAFVDAGIVGPPPGGKAQATVYLSGPQRARAFFLRDAGLAIADLGDDVGAASSLKLFFSGLNKGFNVLGLAVFAAAEQAGVAAHLYAALAQRAPGLAARLDEQLPRLPSVAGRWAAEMTEVADELAAQGQPPGFHTAAAAVLRSLAAAAPADNAAASASDVARILSRGTGRPS